MTALEHGGAGVAGGPGATGDRNAPCPAVRPVLALSAPDLTAEDAEAVRACVASGWVSTAGPAVARFEAALARFVGVPAAVALSSGTAALHLALLAAGVEEGDEVWASDLSFVATANAARHCGATVRLVDAERRTWNLDPDLVVAELRRRAQRGDRLPAAIVAAHVFGHPADLAPIAAVASELGVPLVEDAAEGLGGGYREGVQVRSVGTLGDLGCFSFNGNKMLTTGGGGAVVARDPQRLARIRHLAAQARVPGLRYDHDEVGFNLRMPAVNAALGVGQVERLPTTVAARRAVAARYDRAFAGVDGLSTQPDEPWAHRCGWLSAVLFDDGPSADRVAAALAAEGIEARPLWTPLHRTGPYRSAWLLGTGAVGDDLARRGLCLPSSASLALEDQQRVIDVVLASVQRVCAA